MNIFIVGPMGSGKSTVGKIISSELFLNFFDTDEEIESRTGASIDWIFDLEGEEGFRKRESQILEEMVQQNSIVLSTGGEIILSEPNRELLSFCRAETFDLSALTCFLYSSGAMIFFCSIIFFSSSWIFFCLLFILLIPFSSFYFKAN